MSDGRTRTYMTEREWLCFEDGVKYERERITKWVEANRRALHLGEDSVIYRDDFDSEYLLEFIGGTSNEGS